MNGGQTWIQTFGYDRYGNRTSHSETVDSQAKQINEVTLPAVDANTNKFSNTTDYEFDAVGNLIRDINGRQFIFNGDNKQVEVSDAQNNPVGVYKYDGLGKRIKKETATEYVVFVYDGFGKLIGEYSTDGPPQNPMVHYTATDPLGSPRVLTNENGEIISRRDFMPFGEEIAPDTNYRTATHKYGVGDNVRQKFTGYEHDEETGLDFAEARYYYNNHGRFTAVDPLLASGKSANPQTFNRYAYTMNRPLVLTDPTGLQAGAAVRHELEHSFPDLEERLRAEFPVLSEPDRAIVNNALDRARDSVSVPEGGRNRFSEALVANFRPAGNTVTPSEALEAPTAATAASISITRDSNTNEITEANVATGQVYDGRTSVLLIDHDGNPQTPQVTMSQFFQDNPTVAATEYLGYVFVGETFFSQDADGQAKSMIHEFVVHVSYDRSDTDFGNSRTNGSREINRRIDRAWPRRPR